ncbi:hypothetical protein MAR_030178, partial [Mya arenaria]
MDNEETDSTVCHEKVERAMGKAFHRYGEIIFRHPVKIIVMILILNGALGIGMIKLKEDIDVSRVYTPMNSQATKDETSILALFPDRSGTEFYGYQTVSQPRYATVYVKGTNGNV